jgi:hypothetical protein
MGQAPSAAPTSSPTPDEGTLSGTGFTGATSVTFGGVAGTSLTVISDSILQVTSPAASKTGTVPIIVVTPSGKCAIANSVSFTYG